MPYSETNADFDRMLKRLGELHDRKNRGYANTGDPLANFRIANRFGISTSKSIAVRLSDKINRWLNVYEQESLDEVGESPEDTMEDLVVYGMLWLVAREEERDMDSPVPLVPTPPKDQNGASITEDKHDFLREIDEHVTVGWTPTQYEVRHELFDKPKPVTEEDIMLAPPAVTIPNGYMDEFTE